MANVYHDAFQILEQSANSKPKNTETKAAIADFRCLLNLAPQNPGNLANVACGRVANLEPLAEQVTYMKGVLQVAGKKLHKFVVDQVSVISPYQGGIHEHVANEKHPEKRVKVAGVQPRSYRILNTLHTGGDDMETHYYH